MFLENIETIEAELESLARLKEPISAVDRISHHIASTSGMRYDPSTNRYQPDMPRIPTMETRWGPSAWKLRAVDGFAGYHLFFTDAKEGVVQEKYGYSKKTGGCIHGDILLVQVAKERDENGRWHYEHIDKEIMEHERLLESCMDLLSNRNPHI